MFWQKNDSWVNILGLNHLVIQGNRGFCARSKKTRMFLLTPPIFPMLGNEIGLKHEKYFLKILQY